MTAFLDTFAMLIVAIVGVGVLFALGLAMRIMLGRRAAVKELAELRKLVDEMEVTYTPDFPPPRTAPAAILIDEPIGLPLIDGPKAAEPDTRAYPGASKLNEQS